MTDTVGTLPKVSVAIASYNYERYLRQCVESAQSQTGVQLEIVIVDDCSTDNSVALARQLAEKDSRIRVVEHDVNKGHISTFNESLWACTHDYIVKLDSDDMLTPGSLQRGAEVLAANPSVGFVYGNPLTITDGIMPLPRTRQTGVKKWKGHEWLDVRCRRATNVIMQPEVMVRASALQSTDGHRAHLPASHDLNLWLRLAAIGDVARINGADQGIYRIHQDSLLRSKYGGIYADLVNRRRAFDDFFESTSPSLLRGKELGVLRRSNHVTLARQALRYAMRSYDTGATMEDPVQRYIDFAKELCSSMEKMPEWRGLCRRAELGPDIVQESPRFRMEEQWRVAQDSLRWRRWRRFGI